MPAGETESQKALKKLIIELGTAGLQEVYLSMAAGELPSAAAAWNRDLEAEACEALVERITGMFWGIMFGDTTGIHYYLLAYGQRGGVPQVNTRGKCSGSRRHKGVQLDGGRTKAKKGTDRIRQRVRGVGSRYAEIVMVVDGRKEHRRSPPPPYSGRVQGIPTRCTAGGARARNGQDALKKEEDSRLTGELGEIPGGKRRTLMYISCDV